MRSEIRVHMKEFFKEPFSLLGLMKINHSSVTAEFLSYFDPHTNHFAPIYWILIALTAAAITTFWGEDVLLYTQLNRNNIHIVFIDNFPTIN